MKEENNKDKRSGKNKIAKRKFLRQVIPKICFLKKKNHKFFRYLARLIRKKRETTQLPITEIKVVASLHVPQILK